MARPAETYRGARRNAARGCPWPGIRRMERLDGSNWRKTFDGDYIKQRPYWPKRSWDYSKGGRSFLDRAKAMWLPILRQAKMQRRRGVA